MNVLGIIHKEYLRDAKLRRVFVIRIFNENYYTRNIKSTDDNVTCFVRQRPTKISVDLYEYVFAVFELCITFYRLHVTFVLTIM